MITGPEMAPCNIIRGLSLFLTSSLFLIFIFADFTRYFGVFGLSDSNLSCYLSAYTMELIPSVENQGRYT